LRQLIGLNTPAKTRLGKSLVKPPPQKKQQSYDSDVAVQCIVRHGLYCPDPVEIVCGGAGDIHCRCVRFGSKAGAASAGDGVSAVEPGRATAYPWRTDGPS